MSIRELKGKVLYFEMHTHAPDKSALFFTKGWAKMDVIGSHVTVAWPDFPGATSFKRETFDPKDVANFKTNADGKSYELVHTSVTPDYVYIEESGA
jgi:hypothetical protein